MVHAPRALTGLALAGVVLLAACDAATPSPAPSAAASAARRHRHTGRAERGRPHRRPPPPAAWHGLDRRSRATSSTSTRRSPTTRCPMPRRRLLFDQLLMYDAGTKLVPGLAEAMPTVSADGKTYTFKLRKGVQFYKPDGTVLREMTADDVVASLNRILDPNLKPNPSPVGPAFFSIIAGAQDVIDGKAKTASGLRAVDPLTVEIELVAPDKRLLNIVAMSFGAIVPAEAGEDATAFGAAPIGTGPYHLAEYKQGEKAVLVRNDDYWGETAAQRPASRCASALDANTQLQQVTANQLDLMGDFIPAGSYNAVIERPDLTERVQRRTDVALFYLSIDTQADSPLSDVKVRQAMNYAIDKDNLVRLQNGRGGTVRLHLPAEPARLRRRRASRIPTTSTRPRRCMAEAGHTTPFKTKLYTDPSELSKSMAEAIQVDLGKIGIDVEIVLQEFDVLLGTITTPHQAPLVYIGWFQDFPDPSDFIDPDPVVRDRRRGRSQRLAVLQRGRRRRRRGRARGAGRHQAPGHVPGHPEADHGRRAMGADDPQRDRRARLGAGRRGLPPPRVLLRPPADLGRRVTVGRYLPPRGVPSTGAPGTLLT